MSLARKYSKRYSFEEYLKLEEASKIRNEFHDGAIIPVEATTKNSTAKYDKTGKFFKYQRIPSLKQYILISQYACAVEFYKKMENGQWVYSALSQLNDILSIPCIDAQIPLSELYVDISFEEL